MLMIVLEGGSSFTDELAAIGKPESSMYCSESLWATTIKNTIRRKTTSIIGVKSGESFVSGTENFAIYQKTKAEINKCKSGRFLSHFFVGSTFFVILRSASFTFFSKTATGCPNKGKHHRASNLIHFCNNISKFGFK